MYACMYLCRPVGYDIMYVWHDSIFRTLLQREVEEEEEEEEEEDCCDKGSTVCAVFCPLGDF